MSGTDESAAARYPGIRVKLTGTDGNAFAVLGTVRRAMLGDGVSSEIVQDFFAEATSGDYDHLLATVMRWVDVS